MTLNFAAKVVFDTGAVIMFMNADDAEPTARDFIATGLARSFRIEGPGSI